MTGLVAPGVVNTMPEATLRAVADHGQVPADSIHGHYDEARQLLGQLREAGIGYDDIMQGLEDDAVAKFDAAWEQLGEQLAATLRAPASTTAQELTMSMETTYVIAGASLAGAKAAETLRAEGFDGPLLLIGAESERPYERPPLSKDYLLGKAERETIYVHPQQWYAEHDIDLRLGVAVTGIDPAAHEVGLADGSRVGYSKLLLATGSSPRRFSVPGAGLDGVLYLRSVADSDQIKDCFPVSITGRVDRRRLDRPGDRGRGPRRRRRGHRAGDGGTAAAAGPRPPGRPDLRRPAP